MAKYCPNRKKSQQKPPFKKGYGQGTYPNKKFKQYVKQARVAGLDSDDEYQEDPSYIEEIDEDITNIAAKTARFMDEQKETWVQEMKNLGVDFQKA